MAIVVKGYPRLSETFVTRELLALEARGLRPLIVSLRHPTDRHVHSMNEQVAAPILYLPEYLHQDIGRVLGAILVWIARPTFWRLLLVWLSDLARDRSVNRVRRLGQALVLAAELPDPVRHIHVHYLHTPASVGRYAAMLRRCGYTLSAHAKDIWTTPALELRQKLLAARWTVTCTKNNLDHLRDVAPAADIELLYHGVAVDQFAVREPLTAGGLSGDAPLRIGCVARAVPKKGLSILLEALARLPCDFPWVFEHAGGGPEMASLRRRANELGLADRISWHGAVPQDEVARLLGRIDLFCLPALVADDGDRDGLPNVILEAMAAGVPVIASDISAIPEAVEHERTGILVPTSEPQALGEAILALGRDRARRVRMGEAARATVERRFSSDAGIDRLAMRLRAEASRGCA